jgi:Protein of unknown function (DUF4241)
MPLPAPDFERLFAPGTRHTIWGGQEVTIRLRTGASLWLPSGRVVAGEPFMYFAGDDSDGFVQRVPPGHYPVVLILGVFGDEDGEDADAHATVAAARLVIRDEPVASWEMAVYDGQDVTKLGDDGYYGYPVDGGTGGFVDAQVIPSLDADGDYFDRLMEALGDRDKDYTAPVTLIDDDSEPVVVAFSSGGGDGSYPTWVGRTAGGEVACLLTDFFLLPDETDADDEGARGDEPPAEKTHFALGDFAQGDQMRAGQTLRRQSLTSPSGKYTLVHQDDRNLVLYHNTQFRVLWAAGTDGAPAQVCALHGTHGLVLLDGDGGRVWSSGVESGTAARLVVRDDGDIAVEDSAGAVVWSSGTAEAAVPEGPVAMGDRMLPGQTLGRQSLTSASGWYTFVHQDDGNLVLYDNAGRGAVWSSGTQERGTGRLVLHLDGNLAIYDREARVVWSTDTAGHPGSVLTVQDDGLALRAPDGAVLWSVQTGPVFAPQQAVAPSLGLPLSPVTAGTPGRAPIPVKPASEGRAMTQTRPMIPATRATPATPARPARPAAPAKPAVRAEPREGEAG